MTIQLEEAKFFLRCVSTKPATMLGDDTIKEMAAMLVWSLARLQEAEWAGDDLGTRCCPFCAARANRAGGPRHTIDCPVFTVDGQFKRPTDEPKKGSGA